MSAELAGRLRELVTLQRREDARDAIGGAAGGWRAIGDYRAAIEPRPAGPQEVADALDARPRWRVTLRAGSGARPGDRLAWRGRLIAVRAVTDDPATPERTLIEAEEER